MRRKILWRSVGVSGDVLLPAGCQSNNTEFTFRQISTTDAHIQQMTNRLISILNAWNYGHFVGPNIDDLQFEYEDVHSMFPEAITILEKSVSGYNKLSYTWNSTCVQILRPEVTISNVTPTFSEADNAENPHIGNGAKSFTYKNRDEKWKVRQAPITLQNPSLAKTKQQEQTY